MSLRAHDVENFIKSLDIDINTCVIHGYSNRCEGLNGRIVFKYDDYTNYDYNVDCVIIYAT